MTDLQQQLLDLAERQAVDLYECDLDRLDSEILDAYLEMVTPENLEELAGDIAFIAWFNN